MSVRTGRPSPDLLSSIVVEVLWGNGVLIQQLGSISVADGNTPMVNVFDAGAVASVEKAIMASDLGLNPQADGSIVPCVFQILQRIDEMSWSSI